MPSILFRAGCRSVQVYGILSLCLICSALCTEYDLFLGIFCVFIVFGPTLCLILAMDDCHVLLLWPFISFEMLEGKNLNFQHKSREAP